MSLSIPFTFTGGPGNKIIAAQVNANFQTIAARFTEGVGGIADGDIAAAAGIKGTKLTNIIGQRIPNDRFDDNTVGPRASGNVLATYADDASDSLRGVQTGSIQNNSITNAKIPANSLLAGRLKTIVHTTAFSAVIATNTSTINSYSFRATSPFPPAYGTGMLPLFLFFQFNTVAPPASVYVDLSATPDVNGAWYYTVRASNSIGSIGTVTVAGTVTFIYLAAS